MRIFSIYLALVGLLSRMSPDVFRMILLRKEILLAILTAMLLDLQMNPLTMIDKGRIGFEGRSAFGAQETLDIFVDGNFMNSQS